jgi:hypothetical protein
MPICLCPMPVPICMYIRMYCGHCMRVAIAPGTGIAVLPVCFFNPHWIAGCGDGCSPWTDRTPSMWNGPFAIHVHGGIWKGQPPANSDYCTVADLIAKRLADLDLQGRVRCACADAAPLLQTRPPVGLSNSRPVAPCAYIHIHILLAHILHAVRYLIISPHPMCT